MLKARVDNKKALKALDRLAKQATFATAVALTRTAKYVQLLEEQEVSRSFHMPTPFVRRGFYVRPASVANLQSIVGIKDRQSRILAPHIRGGGRSLKSFERRLAKDTTAEVGYWVPARGIQLDARGNLTKSQIQQIALALRRTGKFSNIFLGRPNGRPNAPYGIWGKPLAKGKGTASGLYPLLIKVDNPNYRRRFDFFGIARAGVDRAFSLEFRRALLKALETAR